MTTTTNVPYLGVSTAERASGSGAAIRQVVPDAPADDAGLRAGDAIVRIGTTRVDAPSVGRVSAGR